MRTATAPSPCDDRALAWWRVLCGVAVLNVVAWTGVCIAGPSGDSYGAAQLTLSAVYVLVCAYRSVLPRVDLERLVVFDTTLSCIALGRAAATVAEICFGVQLGLFVHRLGTNAGVEWVQHTAWIVPVCFAAAQLFCWHSVLTLNHVTQAVESSLWGVGMAWAAALLTAVMIEAGGATRAVAAVGVLGALLFVLYVVAVDVPMYVRRYREGRAAGVEFLDLAGGLRDAWRRRVPSRSWAHWRDDACWLTPYFSAGVWISLALVFVPRA